MVYLTGIIYLWLYHSIHTIVYYLFNIYGYLLICGLLIIYFACVLIYLICTPCLHLDVHC